MALNTANNRASAVGVALAFVSVFPIPDGTIIAQADRQQIAYTYRGILSVSFDVSGIAEIGAAHQMEATAAYVMELKAAYQMELTSG